MNGFVVFIIILIIVVPLGYGGWVFYSRNRAAKLGLPPPSLNPFARNTSSAQSSNYPGPAPVGIKGWFDAQIYKFKNRNNRTAAGSYEPSAGGAGGYSGRGAGSRLDPDEAWDARVGNEAYYEEQELGLHEPAGGRGGRSQTANPFESEPFGNEHRERGRSRTREYDDGQQFQQQQHMQNPFGDDNAASLRGVSPRPMDHGVDTSYGGAASAGGAAAPVQQKKPKKAGSVDSESLNDTRRSLFREDI
ncbi:unnamed protein product [Periconia digitata]|uniref:Uncharacterized protein n=1 Tax=Periconia digitata TaxID=1303443 RepID=A0A9W4UTF6_9PLEO|nr:unnamed protein product [Periconia digitata]